MRMLFFRKRIFPEKARFESPARQTWRRLRKNGPAMTGLFIIAAFFLLAIFAYLIIPDKTTNADEEVVQVALQKPGFHIQFLSVETGTPREQSVLSFLVNGKRNDKELIPVSSYTEKGDSIIAQEFRREGSAARRQAFQKDHVHVFSRRFLLGTDYLGRDIFSRIILGTRISLSVGLIAVLISLLIGVTLGALAGYYRGLIDRAVMMLVNIIWSIPTILFVFALSLALGRGFWQIFIAVGLTMWVQVARLIRGQVLGLRKSEYVEAAQSMGFRAPRIIFRHILPNILGPVMVIAAADFAAAILIEAGLSFIGIGVQPPTPSWGMMIRENYGFIIGSNPVIALAPGVAIMLLVLAFNLLGNGLRDALDVKMK